jgi:hypothetical protein
MNYSSATVNVDGYTEQFLDVNTSQFERILTDVLGLAPSNNLTVLPLMGVMDYLTSD